MGNHCRQAQKLKWSWSLTGGGCLREAPTVRLCLENFGVLDWRSLLGSCRLQGVVAHGGSTRYSITTQFFSDPDVNKVRNIDPKVN